MLTAVEYVIRPDFTGKRFDVRMIELDASVTPAKFVNSTIAKTCKSLAAAEKAAADFRKRDELHIDKVCPAA